MKTVGPILTQTPKLAIHAPLDIVDAGAAFAEIMGLSLTASVPIVAALGQHLADASLPQPKDDMPTKVLEDGGEPAVAGADHTFTPPSPFWPQSGPSVSLQHLAFMESSPHTAGSSSSGVIGEVAPDGARNAEHPVRSTTTPIPPAGAHTQVAATPALILGGMAAQIDTTTNLPRNQMPVTLAPLPLEPRQLGTSAHAAVPFSTPPLGTEARVIVEFLAPARPDHVVVQGQQASASADDPRNAGQGVELVFGPLVSTPRAAASIPTVTARSYAFLQAPSESDTAQAGVAGALNGRAFDDPRDALKDRILADQRGTLTAANGHGTPDSLLSGAEMNASVPVEWIASADPEGPVGAASAAALPILTAGPPSTPGPVGAGSAQAVPITALPHVVATAFRDDPAQQVELRLDPPELGSVRFQMDQRSADLVVTIIAERPDTLDLMRRHGDQLLADLRQAGFQGASLSFGTSHGQAGQGMPQTQDLATDAPTEPPPFFTTPTPPPPRAFKGGLNLRL
jgi:hypothetical protein